MITIELCVLYSVGLLCGHNVGSHPLIIWVGMVDTKPMGGLPLVITCSMDQSKNKAKPLTNYLCLHPSSSRTSNLQIY